MTNPPGAMPPLPEPLNAEVLADLMTLHGRATKGVWSQGTSSHHTVAKRDGQEDYHIANFHHADDATFADVAHKYMPLLIARVAELEAAVAGQEPPGGDWYCEEHPEHLMDHDGCTGAGIPECARVGQIANQLRLARQEIRETARRRDDLVAQYRNQAAALREAVDDAAFEYSRYIVEDTAPSTLRLYMMDAFDAALTPTKD